MKIQGMVSHMGGYGSGRTRTHDGISDGFQLSARKLAAWGWLDRPGWYGTYQWITKIGERIIAENSISITVYTPRRDEDGRAVVAYNRAGTSVHETIVMRYRRGGWCFVCAGCGNTYASLYLASRLSFGCRRCYGLVYQSSRESSKGKSATFAAILQGEGWDRSATDRRLIWTLQAYDRLDKQRDRLYGVRANYLTRVRKQRRKAARTRWYNAKRRAARRHQRIAAYRPQTAPRS